MPKCVDCGVETDRSEMLGAPDDLRCPSCAHKRGAVYQPVTVARHHPTGPVITVGVIALSVVVSLLDWNWKGNPVTPLLIDDAHVWDGQFWRLLTSVFLHQGMIHLLFNVYWTWQFGRALEEWMGPTRFTGLFVLLAFGSSAPQFLLAGGIGLSGVVYGYFGLLYALRRDKGFAAQQLHHQIVQLFIGWFFLCIVLTYTDVWQVGNVAHGAGAVLGWLVGRAVLLSARSWSSWWSLAGLSFGVVCLVAATLYMPWNGYYAMHRGKLYLQKRDYVNALYWYRKASRDMPDNRELPALIHDLELEGKQLDE